MRRSIVLLAAAALLAGCVSERQQCINRVTADLKVVNRLVEETRENIQRGYALEETQIVRERMVLCGETRDADGNIIDRDYCRESDIDTIRKPVAINLAAEQAKLDSLLAQQAQLESTAAAGIKACIAAYPEA